MLQMKCLVQSIKWNKNYNGCLGVTALILIEASNRRKEFEQYDRASWHAAAAAVHMHTQPADRRLWACSSGACPVECGFDT